MGSGILFRLSSPIEFHIPAYYLQRGLNSGIYTPRCFAPRLPSSFDVHPSSAMRRRLQSHKCTLRGLGASFLVSYCIPCIKNGVGVQRQRRLRCSTRYSSTPPWTSGVFGPKMRCLPRMCGPSCRRRDWGPDTRICQPDNLERVNSHGFSCRTVTMRIDDWDKPIGNLQRWPGRQQTNCRSG